MATNTGIWVFAEQRDGKLLDISLEMLGGARGLAEKTGQEVSAVLLGDKIAPLAKELAAYGADKVYVADSPLLKYYCAANSLHCLLSPLLKHRLWYCKLLVPSHNTL